MQHDTLKNSDGNGDPFKNANFFTRVILLAEMVLRRPKSPAEKKQATRVRALMLREQTALHSRNAK